MRILIVATKPPWPRVGGGNVVLHDLIGGLLAAGVDVALVAAARSSAEAEGCPWPALEVELVPGLPRPWWQAAGHLLLPPPLSLARFRSRRLATVVRAAIARQRPDVVHLEQLHVAWLASTLPAGHPPVLLRQQNVESRLAGRWAAVAPWWRRLVLRREARRLAQAEAAACAAVDLVAAISEPDAMALRELAPTAPVVVLPASFAAPASPASPDRLAGDPPLLLLGSFDWGPTREGAVWFLRDVWPELAAAVPAAVIHLAGPGSSSLVPAGDHGRVVVHGRVGDPTRLYDPRAISLIALRAGSGVRVRLLEAWSLGVPVVTTVVGGEGLVAADGDGALLAGTGGELVHQVVRLAREPKLRQRLVAGGRRRILEHRPEVVAVSAVELYRRLAGSG
jgi:glycosyltransferase involved in cell wall biosynthesis